MSRIYIVYDGRATYPNDTDDAQVLECIGPCSSLEQARKEALESWDETDSVLYSYRPRGDMLTDRLYHGTVCRASVGVDDG